MYIRWISHPFDPTKNNTKEHVARSVAEVAVAYKQAVLCPRPNYGTPEWFAERQALDAPFTTPPAAPIVEWGCLDKDSSRFSIVRVVKRVGAETTYFREPPADAPPSVVARFRELNVACVNPEGIKESRVQEGYRQAAQQTEEKAGVFRHLFGGGK